MRRQQIAKPIFAALFYLVFSGCSQPPASDSSNFADDTSIGQIPDFGSSSTPAFDFNPDETGDANAPENQLSGVDTTLPGLGVPGTQSPFAGLSPQTQTPGLAPLDQPQNYNFQNLIPNITASTFYADPTNTRLFPNPQILNTYYCSLRPLLPAWQSNYYDLKAAYIQAIHIDLLGRLVGPSGFVHWMGKLSNEYSVSNREVVARGILRSRWSFTRMLNGLYRTVLERARRLRQNEGESYINRLHLGEPRTGNPLGTPIEDIITEMYALNEVWVNKAARNPNRWVAYLYRKILGRNAIAWELTHWTGRRSLTSVTNRRATAKEILNSFESRQKFVEAMYAQYMGRIATSSEIQAAVNRLASTSWGRLNEIQNLLGSNEYFTNSSSQRFRPYVSTQFCGN